MQKCTMTCQYMVMTEIRPYGKDVLGLHMGKVDETVLAMVHQVHQERRHGMMMYMIESPPTAALEEATQ